MNSYPLISEHGLIGDLQTAALVSTGGTVDWLCLPRFDSPSVFASLLDADRGGRFRIEVFPGGQIMQPLECFDGTSRGTIEAFMGTATYWAEKEPAIEWFATIPFGMNPEGMAAWFYQGDGLKLWEETYAAFNLVPRPGPAFAPQMGGWFRKKINTMADFKGLKMRVGNSLARKIIARAGATTVLTPASDIYAALERGVIDTAEWVGPHDDMKLGLHNTAGYYYYPGWHEPGTMSEFTFNRKAYEALPVDLRQTLDHAAAAVQAYGLTDFHAKNAAALQRLLDQPSDIGFVFHHQHAHAAVGAFTWDRKGFNQHAPR